MRLLLPIISLLIANPDSALTPAQTGNLTRPQRSEYYNLPDAKCQADLFQAYWTPSQKNVATEISYLTSEDSGGLYNAEVTRSSGNAQLDAECLEAVCTTPPEACAFYRTGIFQKRIVDFSGLQPYVPYSNEVSCYIKEHPKTAGIVIHEIPLAVSSVEHYYKLVSVNELRCQENLCVIDRANYQDKIRHIAASWNYFFEKHPSGTTREEINEWARHTLRFNDM
jgi:hypothetical protein